MSPSTIVITGAAGRIGSMLRPRLARPGRRLRLLDVVPVPALAGGQPPAALLPATRLRRR